MNIYLQESNGASSQDPARQVETAESTPVSATPTSSSTATTPVSSAPEMVAQLTEQAADASLKNDEKPEEEISVAQ